MARIATTLLALSLSVTIGACGGGGGEDDGPLCSLPGTLQALAIQGDPAPDTLGDFAAFPDSMPLDAAPNGWAVFVASTTDGSVPTGLFVAEPDGTVHLVYGQGDVVPDAGGGTISAFVPRPLEVTSDGRILCHVQIAGDAGGRTFGLLTARVTAGAVTDRHDVIYSGADMTASGVAGTLAILDVAQGHLAEGGGVFFGGTTNQGKDGFWRAASDGTALEGLIGTDDALPLGVQVVTLDAAAIDRTGSRYAVVATTTQSGDRGLYGGQVGVVGVVELAFDGTELLPAAGGGEIFDVHVGGPLLVDASGAVLWVAEGTLASPDDLLLYSSPAGARAVVLRSGEDAPQTGGGEFGSIDLLHCARSPARPAVSTVVSGGQPGIGFAIYGIPSVAADPVAYLGQGTFAPGTAGGGQFTSTFPGLRSAGKDDVAQDGSFVFANLINTGRSGLFWFKDGCGLTVAVSDGAAPGGDVFGTFTPTSAHTTADGVILFRAGLQTAGSGLFRQGP